MTRYISITINSLIAYDVLNVQRDNNFSIVYLLSVPEMPSTWSLDVRVQEREGLHLTPFVFTTTKEYDNFSAK